MNGSEIKMNCNLVAWYTFKVRDTVEGHFAQRISINLGAKDTPTHEYFAEYARWTLSAMEYICIAMHWENYNA